MDGATGEPAAEVAKRQIAKSDLGVGIGARRYL